MSESAGYVGGGGQFMRVRDSSQGFSAELRQKQQLEEDRQRQKQLEQDRALAVREAERQKKLKDNEAKAAEAFRDFHDPRKRGDIVANCMKYAEARGYHRQNYKLANAELLDPQFIKVFHSTKYAALEHAKADAADLTVTYPKCRFCRIRFGTEEELTRHLEITRPCPKCQQVCSSGGEQHRCSVYGGSIIEDRVPEVKYEIGEE